MARYRQLARAPVREALIDFRFEPAVSLDVIDRFVEKIRDAYGEKLDLWEAVFGLDSDEGRMSTHQTGPRAVGRRLTSAGERTFVVQARIAGFTLSRLYPYGRWEDLKGEAQRLWGLFVKETGAVTVSRIAVRYINEIVLPLPFDDFAEFLTCPPQVPPALPQSITGFLSRVTIPEAEYDCTSVVTQLLEGAPNFGPNGASVTVVLDIDVWRECRVAPEQSQHLWDCLDVLRDRKNSMFFEHITEKTAEIYEHDRT
ncbi:TIGR04255 family protein [Caballeronia pedi]|uniref:TIGR04255 family protein n=1 Tax=Caballeronia pedi TaxID=1777141 RepID=UPI000772D0A8|nr:TIGR04255 family protein [Caballeronia pedi]